MDAVSIIKNKKEGIASKANIKELVFYKYLTNDVVVQNVQGLGDLEKICVLVFSKSNSVDFSNEIQRIRSSSPIRGFHYSYELISLCAIALSSTDKDIQSLKTYFNAHGLVDKYVISKLFPNYFTLEESEGGLTSIEVLIKEVFIGKNHQIDTNVLYNAIESAENLIDLFVIEDALKELLKFHPDAKLKLSFNSLKQQMKIYDKKVRYRSNFVFNSVATISIVTGVFYLSKPIINNWDIFEPIAYLKDIIQVSISFISGLAFNKGLNFLTYLKVLKEKQIRFLYKLNGFDYNSIQSIINTPENQE